MQYLNALKGGNINFCSVNLDPIAINKIRQKGLRAILCWAEDLHNVGNGFETDIFMSFQMVEHLIDPIVLPFPYYSKTSFPNRHNL